DRVLLEAQLDPRLERERAAVDPVLPPHPHGRTAGRDRPGLGLDAGQELRAIGDRTLGPGRLGLVRGGLVGILADLAAGLLAGLGLVAEQVAAGKQRGQQGAVAAHELAYHDGRERLKAGVRPSTPQPTATGSNIPSGSRPRSRASNSARIVSGSARQSDRSSTASVDSRATPPNTAARSKGSRSGSRRISWLTPSSSGSASRSANTPGEIAWASMKFSVKVRSSGSRPATKRSGKLSGSPRMCSSRCSRVGECRARSGGCSPWMVSLRSLR